MRMTYWQKQDDVTRKRRILQGQLKNDWPELRLITNCKRRKNVGKQKRIRRKKKDNIKVYKVTFFFSRSSRNHGLEKKIYCDKRNKFLRIKTSKFLRIKTRAVLHLRSTSTLMKYLSIIDDISICFVWMCSW